MPAVVLKTIFWCTTRNQIAWREWHLLKYSTYLKTISGQCSISIHLENIIKTRSNHMFSANSEVKITKSNSQWNAHSNEMLILMTLKMEIRIMFCSSRVGFIKIPDCNCFIFYNLCRLNKMFTLHCKLHVSIIFFCNWLLSVSLRAYHLNCFFYFFDYSYNYDCTSALNKKQTPYLKHKELLRFIVLGEWTTKQSNQNIMPTLMHFYFLKHISKPPSCRHYPSITT